MSKQAACWPYTRTTLIVEGQNESLPKKTKNDDFVSLIWYEWYTELLYYVFEMQRFLFKHVKHMVLFKSIFTNGGIKFFRNQYC